MYINIQIVLDVKKENDSQLEVKNENNKQLEDKENKKNVNFYFKLI
jgi:hypothetical protein